MTITGVLGVAVLVFWAGCSTRPLEPDDAGQAGACSPSAFRCVDQTHSQWCAANGTWDQAVSCDHRCDPKAPARGAQQRCLWNPATGAFDKDCTFTMSACCGGPHGGCCSDGTCRAGLTCTNGICS